MDLLDPGLFDLPLPGFCHPPGGYSADPPLPLTALCGGSGEGAVVTWVCICSVLVERGGSRGVFGVAVSGGHGGAMMLWGYYSSHWG